MFIKKGLPAMLFGIAAGMVTTACISDSQLGDCDEDIIRGEEKQFVSLRVAPISTGAAADGTVKEKLGTLRIIMVNKDENGVSKIEFNELIGFNVNIDDDGATFEGEGQDANLFRYLFTRVTVSGEKTFYLIANESSVGKISYDVPDGVSLPQEVTSITSLTELLDRYVSELKVQDRPAQSENTARGAEFADVMNSVCFEPSYSVGQDGNIFLPYTAIYSGYTIGDGSVKTDDNYIDADMYLVPVATKFNFRFINYRKENVQIDDIKVATVNSGNYLNAQVFDNERTKILYEKPTYWIDWLAEVSRLSQSNSSESDFNTTWGWIDGYNIPTGFQKMNYSLNPDKTEWIINRRINSYTPSDSYLGPFYLPESRNMVTKSVYNPETGLNEDKIMQSYYLSFYMHDVPVETVTAFEDNELESLKSLFRATNVMITVTLYDEQMDIYAEINPWVTQTFKGYLQEEDD